MRLIDADKLCVLPIDEETVENAPTVDAVAVIRCKDCIFRDKFGYCVAPMGEVGYARVDDDDFCSCGFRKKVEHDT